MNNKFLIVSIIVFLLSLSIVCASDVNESQSEKTQTLEVDNDDINSNVNDYNIVSENIGKKNESDSEKINREYKNKTVKRDDESSDISLIVSATDIKYGDTASIFGTLNNNTVPLMQEEITLLLNDEEYTTTTDVNGEYNFSITDYDIGLNEVVVFYDGETDFVYNITSFNVRKLNTTTIITNAIGVVYHNVIECAIVTDECNYVVNEGFVTFILRNQVIGTADVINGLAILNFVYNISVNDTIQAIYSGSDIYNPSNSSQVIVIRKQYANIIISPVFCYVKDTVTFTAWILDEDHNNVSSGKCVMKINGKTVKDENGKVIYAKVNNGISSFNVTLPATLEGIHNYTIVYSGSSAYNGSRTTNTLVVYKRNYTVNLNVTPNPTKREGTVNLTTTINSSNLNINGGKVIFKLNGKTLKYDNGTVIQVGVLNNTAELSYTIPESLSIGDKTMKAVYIDELYDRYETESTFTIAKQDIYIVLEEIDYYANKLVIKADVFNEFNQTINRNITYAVKLNEVTQLISNTNGSTINAQMYNRYNPNNYTLSIVIGESTGYTSYIYTNNITLHNPKISIENDEIYRCSYNAFTIFIPSEYISQNNTLLLYFDELLLLNTTIITDNFTVDYYTPIFYEGNYTLHAIIMNENNQNLKQEDKNITILSDYIYVNSNGDINSNGDTINNPTTLETAVNIANDNQIILLSTLTDTDTYLMTNLTINSTSHNIKIMAQANKTIIFDGNNTNNCMNISNDYDVTFSNIRFINGYNNDCGGLFVNTGNLTIINSTIENNHAFSMAGAIFNRGNITLLNNNISDNSVINNSYSLNNDTLNHKGGIIKSLEGNIFLINNSIHNNSATFGGVISTNNSSVYLLNNTFSNNAGNIGGVLDLSDTLSIQYNNMFTGNYAKKASVQRSISSLDFINNNIYINNNATEKGLLLIDDSTTTVDNCTFNYNHARYASSIYSTTSNLNINNSVFNYNNVSVQGGSIISKYSIVVINNTLFNENNVLNGVGGGIYSESSNLYIDNSTFTNNTAKYGGAICVIGENENSIENSHFLSNNVSIDGGAIYSSKSLLYLNNNTYTSNNAQNNGGAISATMLNTLEVTNSTFQDNNANNYTNIHTIETVTLINNNSFDLNTMKTSVITNELTGNINDNYWGTNTPDFMTITNNNSPQTWKIIENNEYMTINNTNTTEIQTGLKTLSITNNNNNQVNTLIPKKDINLIVDDILTIPDTNITINITFDEKITATVQIIFPDETIIQQYLSNTNQTSITYKTGIQDGLEQIHINLIESGSYVAKSKLLNIFVQDDLSSFNLNDYNMVTSVKNQGSSNACWAFASLGTLESAILKSFNQTTDFSENHLKNIINKYNINGTDADANTGSSLLRPINYLLSWTDPVNDLDDIFFEESILSDDIPSTFHIQDVVFLENYNSLNPQDIKNAILKYGALFTDLSVNGTCDHTNKTIEDNLIISTTVNYYNPTITSPNHAVSLIGWDDTYSRYNFNNNGSIPVGDGAFIIKNSWGTDNGISGFNYVSYYDKSLGTDGFIAFLLDNRCNYSNIYQYETCSVYTFDSNSTEFTIANNYHSRSAEQIQAVGTFFDKESNYTLVIYKNGVEQYTQDGNVNHAGYQTIKLKQYIPLNTGDDFTAMLTIKNSHVKIFVQNILTVTTENITDESFIFNSTTLYNLRKYHLTACLKVYTGYDNQTTQNTNITTGQINIYIPHNEPSQIPDIINNQTNISSNNSLYTIKIPIIWYSPTGTEISYDKSFDIVIANESYYFESEQLVRTYLSLNGTAIMNYENKEGQGFYISKEDDGSFINIELVYDFTENTNFLSIIFNNTDGSLDNKASIIINNIVLCNITIYPGYNSTLDWYSIQEDFITIFSYNNQQIQRVEPIYYYNEYNINVTQTYFITKTKINTTDFLNTSNTIVNHLIYTAGKVFYSNDLLADTIAEALNVSNHRENYTVILCGYNGRVYISALDPNMGMMINGANDNKIMFRFITSYMLSILEEKALDSSHPVNSALNNILDAFDTNSYNVFEDENYLYLVLNDNMNTTLTMDKNTGLVVDYIQYGDNVIHGVQSDDDYTFTGFEIGSPEAELQRTVGSVLMSAAPYCVGIPGVGPFLVPVVYVAGLAICADACGVFKQSPFENSSRWIDFGWDVATSFPVDHIIGFIADSKKIAGIFKNSEVIEQSAKTVENTLKSTIKSTGNYIKTKCMEIVQDTTYFTLDEITHLSKVTENIVKGFLKVLNLPVPKTVYDEFSKDLNLLFKLDTEPLTEHSILNEASYEIFCSRLGQEKSNIMGICYFYYGFSKEAVENFYHDYSEKIIMNITLSMENEILELFHEQYKIISLLNLNKSLMINDYEHYYVAEDYYDTMSVVL
ncbi:MAG: hypothetical protein IJJ47_11310 [Methanosphaera sp.]|nr:hypothetical protein [Methanosphaera sp.]